MEHCTCLVRLQASQIASLQPAVSPSAHAPQAHAASVQRPAVMRAHAVPGTPMTPPAAATAVSPLLSPGIKLTPPECKAMIDAVELAIHDLATAQTPGQACDTAELQQLHRSGPGLLSWYLDTLHRVLAWPSCCALNLLHHCKAWCDLCRILCTVM